MGNVIEKIKVRWEKTVDQDGCEGCVNYYLNHTADLCQGCKWDERLVLVEPVELVVVEVKE